MRAIPSSPNAKSLSLASRASWQLIHEVSGFAVSESLRQMQTMLTKYSPYQPRVPAGSSDGGQWTSGGGGSTLNASEPTPDQVVSGSQLAYPDGTPVINPNTGLPYPKPEGLDIPRNVRFAKDYLSVDSSSLARALIMVGLFRQGGSFDYQSA